MTALNAGQPTTINTSLAQLLKFALIGVSLNLFWFSVYLLLTHFGGEPKTVMSFLYVTATLSSYWLNRTYTFSHDGLKRNSLVKFLFAYFFGYLLNFLGLLIGYDLLNYPHQLIQFAMMFLIAGFLFLLQKHWVFKSPPT